MAEHLRPSLGALADRLYKLRADRLELARQVDEMKKQESVLHDQILLRFSQEGLTSCRGALATVASRKVTRYSVGDWDAALAWIARTGAIELLERRVSQTACREHVAAGEKIDGVDAVEIMDLSITKRGKK